MSAETIRRAAALMRERATANIVTPGPWGFAGVDGQGFAVHRGEHDTVALYANRPDAEHIASWHPAVALAVADWLEGEHVGWVGDFEEYHDRHVTYWHNNNDGPMPDKFAEHFRSVASEYANGQHRPALAVARAYLGEQP